MRSEEFMRSFERDMLEREKRASREEESESPLFTDDEDEEQKVQEENRSIKRKLPPSKKSKTHLPLAKRRRSERLLK